MMLVLTGWASLIAAFVLSVLGVRRLGDGRYWSCVGCWLASFCLVVVGIVLISPYGSDLLR